MALSVIQNVGVVGAGQMGAGIAQVAADSGCEVYLFDAHPGAALRAYTRIDEWLKKAIAKGKTTETEAQALLRRLKVVDTLDAFSAVDCVVEAIVEQTDTKRDLFKRLDQIAPRHAILASNTSSISITAMAAVTTRPDQVIGMHFMNPVPVMQLVEIIRALATSEETYQRIKALAERMKKTTVVAKEAPGFIVNRILMPMLNEAIFALDEGLATAHDIDVAMKLGTNQPMGPLTLADFIGLDTVLSILEVLHTQMGEDKYRPSPLLRRYVSAGWLGKKTGRGFFTYAA